MEIFWKTLADYNAETWLAQLFIVIIGIVLTVALFLNSNKKNALAVKIYIAFLYIWIALVYYFHYCEYRSYTEVMALFWIVMAVIWIWDIFRNYTTFKSKRKYLFLSLVLVMMPIIYPLVSIARGLSFPNMTSPIMPSSIVAYTIGIFLFFGGRVNLLLALLMCHWSLIGLMKTYYYDIPEDFLLGCAIIPAIYLFFKNNYIKNLDANSKPSGRFINIFFIILCCMTGVGLMTIMAIQLL